MKVRLTIEWSRNQSASPSLIGAAELERTVKDEEKRRIKWAKEDIFIYPLTVEVFLIFLETWNVSVQYFPHIDLLLFYFELIRNDLSIYKYKQEIAGEKVLTCYKEALYTDGTSV